MPGDEKPRVAGVLIGDVERDPAARTKYQPLLTALAEHVALVGVLDATLRGLDRLRNAAQSFHPQRARWRERFYKNPYAFRRRSLRAGARLMTLQPQAVLQVGVLFDAGLRAGVPPVVIYTDYTAALSARKPEAGRSPLRGAAQAAWLALERQAYQRASHICVRSRLVRQSLLDDYGITAERISVVGGGANFEPQPAAVRPGGGDPTALFIGKEFTRKGGDLLLEAFARVRRQQPAQLLLVTDAPFAAADAPPGVELVAPTWNRDVIAELYRRADLLVLPSRLETWGDVLLEAMAFGLPVIATAGDAMGEIVQHEKTGLLVPDGDIDALSAALARLFADDQLRVAWGENGRQRVREQFLWHHVAGRIAPRLHEAALSHR